MFDGFDETIEMVQASHDCCIGDPKKLDLLFKDAKKSLYHGCKKFTKLFKLVKLFNIKVRHEFSDQCFSNIFYLINELLSKDNQLSLSMYEAKKDTEFIGHGV